MGKQPIYLCYTPTIAQGAVSPHLVATPLRWGLTGKPISLRENLSSGRERKYLGRESKLQARDSK